MTLVAYLVLVCVLLGLGTLVASILPTGGARIGLGAVLFLAVVVDATWFFAPMGGWSAALGDAAWVGAFGLAGLLAWLTALHYRGEPDQTPWHWPGERDVALLVVLVALFGALVMVLPVPLDTDAQGFGYLALTLRDGGDFTTLAPWHPETDYLYSPGYIGLVAHFSARFDLGIHTLQLVISAATAVLFAWLAYDLGCELDGRRAGRAFMLAALIGTGMITAFMDSHYTALLSLTFALAFLTFVLHFLQTWRWSSALFAAICLAGVPLSQPDTTIALIIGYVPWLVLLALNGSRPRVASWMVIAAVIPLVALGIAAPWLNSLTDLLGSNIESPFTVEREHWRTLIFMHGGIIVGLAAIGALIGLRQRKPIHLLMLVWLVAIVEFSTLGVLESTLPDVVAPLLKYDYPFSLAWHGPIIPYIVLGGTGLLWLADRLGAERTDRWIRRLAFPVLALALAAIVAGVVFFEPVLEASKERLSFYGAFSSAADVDAMTWLRDNAPVGARVLNHPGPHEADWAPVISERDTVYFRPQPFFRHTEGAEAEQAAFRAFWLDPDNDEANYLDLFIERGVRYVLVPQVFGEPERFEDMIRWRPPLDEAAAYRAEGIESVPYLRLVYDDNGARVYEVALSSAQP
ncbi:MAG: hypothetical protein GX573_02015 [Chloroflexi bacterium]|nr:hypothetical protein [Chloroflexota bacterium]